MVASTIITLPSRMPVTELVSEVSRQVLEWLHSYGTLWDEEKATLRLVKVEKTGKQYRYHYSISLRPFNISAADVEASA